MATTHGTYTFDTQNDSDCQAFTFTSYNGGSGQSSAGVISAAGTAAEFCHDTNGGNTTNTGPTQGQGGVNDGYLYTECSSPGANGDEYTMTFNTTLDASAEQWQFNFYTLQRGNGTIGENQTTCEVQINESGGGWTTITDVGGSGEDTTDGTDWTYRSVDLSESGANTDSSTQVRLLITTATNTQAYYGDYGIDTVTIVGSDLEGISSVDSDYGDASDELDLNENSLDVNGLNFESSQNSGTVYLADESTLAASDAEVDLGNAIQSWSDTTVNLDLTALTSEHASLESLMASDGPSLYIILVNNSSDEYYLPVTVHRAKAFDLSDSTYITAGGANTSYQLTPPATKSTGDFGGGRIQDDENPADTVDLGADEYGEWEWSMEAKIPSDGTYLGAQTTETYQFRLLNEGVVLDTYTVTPEWTIVPSGGNYDQDSYRGKNDTGGETSTDWITTVNTDWDQAVDANFRVRFLIEELDDIEDLDVGFQLQYNHNGAGWNNVNASSSVARSSASPNVTDGVDTTEQLSGPGTFISTNAGFDEVDGLAGGSALDFTTTANQEVELEYCLQLRNGDVEGGDTIQLRLVKSPSYPLGSYTNTPSLTVALPYITDMEDEQIDDDETDNVISGGFFEADQGTGKVELVDNIDYSSGTIFVTQTIDTWSDTSIQFDSVFGGLSDGTVYIFVTNNSGQRNVTGYAVNLGSLPPTITDCEDEQINDGETNIILDGTGFENSQGSGKVELVDNISYGSGTIFVTQTIDTWTSTQIQFDSVRGALDDGTVYIFVTTNSARINATGYAVNIGSPSPVITDMEDEQLDTAETDNVLTGTDFLESQGTGKVEICNNAVYGSATIFVTQTIDSWADTSIQFDFVQGTLPNGAAWIFVTTGYDRLSNGYAVNLGPVPQDSYEDEIQAMTNSPQHLWTLQNTYTDTGVSSYHYDANSSGNGSPGFSTSTPLLCRDDTHAFYLSAANQYTSPNEAYDDPRSENDDYNAAHNTQWKSFWCRLDRYHQAPSILWEEGANVNDMCLLVGFGNTLLANALSDTADVQVYSDKPLKPNRNYLVTLKLEGTGYDNEVALFIDGVRQTRDSGNPWGIATFLLHNGDQSLGWNQQTGTYGQMNIGGSVMEIGTAVGTRYSHWCSWHDIPLTDSDVSDTLFELGVGPDEIITGTPSAMQTAIEANDDTNLPDAALTYYVDAPTGTSNVTLTLTNQVFHADTTLHFQWRGGGALTIINGGTSNVDAAKCSNPWGGSITVVDTVPITFTVSDSSGNPIPGARVAVYKESDDTEISNDTTNENGVMEYALYQYTSDTDIYFRIRRSSNYASFLTSSSGVDAGSDFITTTSAHGFEDGEDIVYSREGGTADIGPEPGTWYVNSITSTTLSLHSSAANAISDTSRADLSTDGAETHTLTPTRYKRVSGSGTITSTGLSVSAILTEDTITS